MPERKSQTSQASGTLGTRTEQTVAASGEGEEELLHLLDVDAVEVVVLGEALLEAGGDDGAPSPVEGLETAASWVTTSSQSRPASSILRTPASWP